MKPAGSGARPRWRATLSALAASAMILTALAAVSTPAEAAPDKVLILSSTVTSGTSSDEAQAAAALGFTVELATPAQWAAKTAADFASYRALILGDPTCAGPGTAQISAAEGNRTTWGPEIDGNVIVNGTDPVYHRSQGGLAMTQKGIAFATDVAGKTGMYVSMSCYYHGAAPMTPVPLLDPFGSFTATGVGCFNDAHIVATHPALIGMTDASLSNWGCSVHEGFDSFPSSGPNAFIPLVIAENAPGGNYTAPDGTVGFPYVLARGEGLSAGNISLAPGTSSGNVGETHTMTATTAAAGSPLVGKTISFTVLTGPHAGATGSGVSDSGGQATFSYVGTAVGTDEIQASFTDDLGNLQTSNVVTREWVGPMNTPPTVAAGGPYAGVEGSPVSLDATVSDPDLGDTLTYAWSLVSDTADAGTACSFGSPSSEDSTFTCDDDGTFTVKLTVNDGTDSAESTAEVTLANAAPVITSLTPSTSAPVATGSAVAFDAPFTDAGDNDTHTCSIDWGDASSSAGVVDAGACTASHTYTAAGIYTVELTVTDDDGGSDSATYQYVVVYDPSAGFVTGGGWIQSPEGAYAPDPSLTGKANFGFVSKYKKGATVPDGSTQFQFHAAGFNFHSTSYDWLVVSGPKAQYKGSGTVNGSGDFGFLLTANDGAINGGGGEDRFRIKVWDKSTGDVVYDNQAGEALDAAASQAIDGGSIVIHAKK